MDKARNIKKETLNEYYNKQIEIIDSQIQDEEDRHLKTISELGIIKEHLLANLKNVQSHQLTYTLSVGKLYNIETKQSELDVVGISGIPKDENTLEGYSNEFTWVRKIIFAISKANKPLSTSEIVNYLISIDSALGNPRSKSVASVSAILSMNKGGLFVKSKNNKDENVYELSEKHKKKQTVEIAYVH
jgi:hypothetical protein